VESTSTDERIPPQPELPLRDDMYLTFAEAAAYAGFRPNQIKNWVDAGHLPATRPPGVKARRIRGLDFREFMNSGVAALYEHGVPCPSPSKR
jgi:excisionase family DNA binding protein